MPQQVDVSCKVVEFQTTKGVETGLSAYFAQRNKYRAYGRISSGNGAITSADITFPTSTAAGITVFLDRLRMSEGDLEVVLQALVDENRAFILSRPRAMVVVGVETPTVIRTNVRIPYEKTQVVGATAVQITDFRDTGVTLTVRAREIVDDDNDLSTTDDSYIKIELEAVVKEEGQRLTVALDDQLAAGGDFSLASNALTAPEFIDRSIKTTVWVRHGQVLILGGLYRNTEDRDLSTAPLLTQGEDLALGLAEKVVPGEFLVSPVSSTLGNRSTKKTRRELVFLVKAEVWNPAFGITEGDAFPDAAKPKEKTRPTEVITDVIEGIGGIAEDIVGDDDDVKSSLGGRE
ncbi:MAG TPA: hypothetical protein HPP77_10050 [Candidatus Hydrogenedentes bacterium]|nr:hypothetical protein [Candidatus Hydrogenedentota bacterium]HIJ73528.1 hypothetical protein [Candidatus Hydrogenedentota bacterium]